MGHHEVEQDQPRETFLDPREGGAPVGGLDYRVPFPLERPAEQLAKRRIVVDDEDRQAGPVARQGREAQKQAEQIAGRDDAGRPATESATFEGKLTGGRMTALLVKDVAAGGAICTVLPADCSVHGIIKPEV